MQQRETAQKIALNALRDAKATETLVRSLKYGQFLTFVVLVHIIFVCSIAKTNMVAFVGCFPTCAEQLEQMPRQPALINFWNSITKLSKK